MRAVRDRAPTLASSPKNARFLFRLLSASRQNAAVASDVGVAIVSGGLAGGFALLGVGLTSWRATRRETAAFRRETSLELAGMERLIWGESFTELRAHIERLRARMSEARVPHDLIEAFADITSACWRSYRGSMEETCGEDPGISTDLLSAREEVHEAVRAHLRCARERKKLAAEALLSVRAALRTD
jgi:hypothetical protein